MNIYLTIMVTALVITQVIRIVLSYKYLQRVNQTTDAEVVAMWEKLTESIDKLAERVEVDEEDAEYVRFCRKFGFDASGTEVEE